MGWCEARIPDFKGDTVIEELEREYEGIKQRATDLRGFL